MKKAKKGKVVAKIQLQNSKGIDVWETDITKILALQGNKNLVFKYKDKKGDSLLIDWILFESKI